MVTVSARGGEGSIGLFGVAQAARGRGVMAVFHYQAVHASPFFQGRHEGAALPRADRYTDRLLRLPLFADMDAATTDLVTDAVADFFSQPGRR